MQDWRAANDAGRSAADAWVRLTYARASGTPDEYAAAAVEHAAAAERYAAALQGVHKQAHVHDPAG